MLNIKIKTIGKTNQEWQTQAIHNYLIRLKPYASIEIIEFEEGHQDSTKPNVDKALKIEAERLLKSLPKDAFLIALDETGKIPTSTEFACDLQSISQHGSMIIFLIGGSWGLSTEVKRRAQKIISLSRLTFPHVMARLMLVEQIYRATAILSGKTYHK